MFVGLRNLLLLSACLVIAAGQAWAVALGKVEVTSHLGETFYAEAPIELDAGEKIANVSIELADPSDYRILEVFRDPALNKLSVGVVTDSRGSRAVIKSTEAVDTPYFNLVLKLHYGHATNFKKYPVFLDLPEQQRPSAPAEAPAPQQQAEQKAATAAQPAATTMQPQPEAAQVKAKTAPTGFRPYAGWARTNRYGPMVRGDNITTVAHRLAVDNRFSLNQIMVALYDKNKSRFRAHNINLINAGTYLDVPTAKEVEAISNRDATAFMRKQNAEWKQLQKQPMYAAEAEAQKNRYRTRVHVGETASGTAAAPMQAGQQQAATKQAQAGQKPSVTPVKGGQGAGAAGQGMNQQMLALQQESQKLKQENQQLKQALQESQAKATEAKPTSGEAAAAEAQVKKLELTVARLQRQLKMVNQQMQEVQAQKMNSVTYALSGIILLLIAVAGYLLYLLRRDRPHPPMDAAQAGVAETGEEPAAAGWNEGMGSTEGGDQDVAALTAGLDAGATEEQTGQEDAQSVERAASKPLADVDYLAEAEVYLRYGMDDEAQQQMHLAIEQKPDNLQAHLQLVKFLQSRGDQAATAEAIEAARSMLGGSDLQSFEDSLEGVESDAEGSSADDAIDMDLSPSLQPTSEMDAAMEEAIAAMGGEEEAEEVDKEVASDEQDDALNLDDLQVSASDEEAADSDEEIDLSAQVEEEAGEGLEFVSDIEASPLSEGETEEEEQAQPEKEAEGLDFSVSDEAPSVEVDSDQDAEADKDSDEETKVGLDDVLDELDTDMDLSGGEVRPFDSDAPEEDEVPETVIDSESAGDEMDLDEILGKFGAGEASSEHEDAGSDEAIGDSQAGDGLSLDDILGEFENEAEDEAADSSKAGADAEGAESSGMPEMDVSNELDDLLAEWGDEGKDFMLEAGPQSLDVDRARSLLAEDKLDEAEEALNDALTGERRADALIGLAEVAARRGDQARKTELLAEAEPLLDEGNQEWFEAVSKLSV